MARNLRLAKLNSRNVSAGSQQQEAPLDRKPNLIRRVSHA
jgi:hypothetical protein